MDLFCYDPVQLPLNSIFTIEIFILIQVVKDENAGIDSE